MLSVIYEKHVGYGRVLTEDVQTHSAAVVDEPSQVATLGSIYNCVVVHSEQVAAPNALLCVPLLPIVSHHLDTQHTKIYSLILC